MITKPAYISVWQTRYTSSGYRYWRQTFAIHQGNSRWRDDLLPPQRSEERNSDLLRRFVNANKGLVKGTYTPYNKLNMRPDVNSVRNAMAFHAASVAIAEDYTAHGASGLQGIGSAIRATAAVAKWEDLRSDVYTRIRDFAPQIAPNGSADLVNSDEKREEYRKKRNLAHTNFLESVYRKYQHQIEHPKKDGFLATRQNATFFQYLSHKASKHGIEFANGEVDSWFKKRSTSGSSKPVPSSSVRQDPTDAAAAAANSTKDESKRALSLSPGQLHTRSPHEPTAARGGQKKAKITTSALRINAQASMATSDGQNTRDFEMARVQSSAARLRDSEAGANRHAASSSAAPTSTVRNASSSNLPFLLTQTTSATPSVAPQVQPPQPPVTSVAGLKRKTNPAKEETEPGNKRAKIKS